MSDEIFPRDKLHDLCDSTLVTKYMLVKFETAKIILGSQNQEVVRDKLQTLINQFRFHLLSLLLNSNISNLPLFIRWHKLQIITKQKTCTEF